MVYWQAPMAPGTARCIRLTGGQYFENREVPPVGTETPMDEAPGTLVLERICTDLGIDLTSRCMASICKSR
jgi:hypothetical protein